MAAATPPVDLNSIPDVQKLRGFIAQSGVDGWDRAWQTKTTPWDAGKPHPALIEILNSSELYIPPQGKALVPGCGRGYDAVYIASILGIDTLGVDLSPTAVQAANEYAQSLAITPAPKVAFVTGDFFSYAVPDDEKFDLIYDYTFFCAIPPDLRKAWGEQVLSLVKPTGFLIAVIFPIDGDRQGGPPYSVSVDDYENVLGSSWTKLVDKVPEECHERNIGRVRVVVWQHVAESMVL